VIKRTVIVSLMICAGAGIAAISSAQEKTRAQVHQELIEAERDGLNFDTDESYPVVAPIFEQQAAKLKQQKGDGGTGDATTGASDAGHIEHETSPSDPPACVGPVSFCDPYFGS
jgi:Domain of unknown function (DUF4148)